MKKVYIILILLFMILVTGCENNDDRYKGFEHYTLEQKEIKTHTFYEENNKMEYALADITDENKDEGGVNGIFYKINNNDYILLDKIECCGYANSYNDDSYTLFYKNKLYIIRCSGLSFYEYVFNGSEFIKVDLLSKFNGDFVLSSIEKVDDDFIYLKGHNDYSDPNYKSLKCSLNTMECVLSD